MTAKDESYEIDDWTDAEHCVYHALVDEPEKLTSHRIAHYLSRVTAKLLDEKILSKDEVEEFLRSCRG